MRRYLFHCFTTFFLALGIDPIALANGSLEAARMACTITSSIEAEFEAGWGNWVRIKGKISIRSNRDTGQYEARNDSDQEVCGCLTFTKDGDPLEGSCPRDVCIPPNSTLSGELPPGADGFSFKDEPCPAKGRSQTVSIDGSSSRSPSPSGAGHTATVGSFEHSLLGGPISVSPLSDSGCYGITVFTWDPDQVTRVEQHIWKKGLLVPLPAELARITKVHFYFEIHTDWTSQEVSLTFVNDDVVTGFSMDVNSTVGRLGLADATVGALSNGWGTLTFTLPFFDDSFHHTFEPGATWTNEIAFTMYLDEPRYNGAPVTFHGSTTFRN